MEPLVNDIVANPAYSARMVVEENIIQLLKDVREK